MDGKINSERRKVDWINVTVYAVMTAAVLLLLYWFIERLGERLSGIEWALLLAGTLAAGALVVFVLIRWYVSSQFRALSETAAPAAESLIHGLSGGGDEAVTRNDLSRLFQDVQNIWPTVLKAGRLLLALSGLIMLAGEILLLANAAVMYLQAERLREQNELLRNQSKVSEAVFLNELVTNLSNVIQEIEKIRRSQVRVKEDVLDALSITPRFVSTSMQDVLGQPNIEMQEYRMLVCAAEDHVECNSLALESLLEEAQDGVVTSTDENRSALTGYRRLTAGLQLLTLPITTNFGTQQTSLNDDIQEVSTFLHEASLVCGMPTAERETLVTLWRGISGASLASAEMWPDDTDERLATGGDIILDGQQGIMKFLGLSAAGMLVRQTLGEGSEGISGPQEYADLIAKGLQAFENAASSLVKQFANQDASISGAIAVLNDRRDEMITRIGEGR